MFRVFGIRLALHFSFFLLLAYVAWEGWVDSRWLGVAWSLAFVMALFTCIVLHELGHSLTARRFGIGVRRILLLPIGGMAEFDSIPRQPRRELLITVAGPAVNFTIVLLLWPLITVPARWWTGEIPLTFGGFLWAIWVVNAVMGCFNLLPVFPMDGGRILRSLLAMRWSYLKATTWAANVGKVLAVAGILTAVFIERNLLGALLFSFIFVAGDLEYRAVKRREEESAQWAAVIQRLYGASGTENFASPADLLHGPN